MSAKTHFLKKLQAQQSPAGAFSNRNQADIAAFRLAMAQLQTQMAEWLVDTGIEPESAPTRVVDLLVPGGAFEIHGIRLHHKKRAITFSPLFLYGHGVTGCVEVSLYADGKVTPQSRLFMRAGKYSSWRCTRAGSLSLPERAFDEDAFFGMLDGLLA